MPKYEIDYNRPKRVMHLPARPYLNVRLQENKEYPWDQWVLTLDWHETFFFYDEYNRKFYVDFADGEKQKDQVEALEKLAEDMSEEEKEEFMEGKVTNFRDRIEHEIYYADRVLWFPVRRNLADLVDKLI